MITSSATRFQVEPLARVVGVEHVLCTPTEAGKARLKQFAHSPPTTASTSRSYAHAHGDDDVPFLETVGRSQAVNPKSDLARVASQRGWPVHRFARRGRPGLVQIGRTVAGWGGYFMNPIAV
jgi:phosphoserine phosphatase